MTWSLLSQQLYLHEILYPTRKRQIHVLFCTLVHLSTLMPKLKLYEELTLMYLLYCCTNGHFSTHSCPQDWQRGQAWRFYKIHPPTFTVQMSHSTSAQHSSSSILPNRVWHSQFSVLSGKEEGLQPSDQQGWQVSSNVLARGWPASPEHTCIFCNTIC